MPDPQEGAGLAQYAPHHARKDPMDTRDKRYSPNRAPPAERPLESYMRFASPVFDQGHEHSCTGAALSAIVNYLLHRHRRPADLRPASARMLYEMARKYDGNDDPNHEGSTARAAVKGWHKHGVCAEALWPYQEFDTDHTLTDARAEDARRRQLGSYHRVHAHDLGCLRSAIAEIGIVYVTALVHEGWHRVGSDGAIPYPDVLIGAHAFALVAYDGDGFWLHNSKGPGWGHEGYAKISNADWLEHAQDAWVVELAANASS